MSDWEKEFDGYFMPRGYEGVIGLDPIEVKAFIRKTLLSSQSAHDEEICKRLEGLKKKRARPMSWEADYNQAISDIHQLLGGKV